MESYLFNKFHTFQSNNKQGIAYISYSCYVAVNRRERQNARENETTINGEMIRVTQKNETLLATCDLLMLLKGLKPFYV